MSTSRHIQARDPFSRNGHGEDITVDGYASSLEGHAFAAIQQAVVERLNGQPVALTELLAGRVLLALIDDRTRDRLRWSAEIAWVEERLDPDVRLVLVWRGRPVTLRRLSPARAGTLSVVDTAGDLRQFLERAGTRKALLVDTEAGTVEPVDEYSDVFSLGREIRVSDARGSDHTIDLGDLT